MKLAYDTFEFEGDLTDLALVLESCKNLALLLGAKNGLPLAPGQSYVLDSNQTWDDEDEPGS